MDHNKLVPFNLAETLLKNLMLFRFLNYVDDNYDRRDPIMRKVVGRYFKRWYKMTDAEAEDVMPFLSDNSTLVMLSPLFAFGATLDNEYWKSIGFDINGEYEIAFEDFDVPADKPSPRAVLEVLADACSNLVNSLHDDRFGATIFHAGNAIVFKTPGYQLTFRSAVGLGVFLQRYTHVASRAIRENLLQVSHE